MCNYQMYGGLWGSQQAQGGLDKDSERYQQIEEIIRKKQNAVYWGQMPDATLGIICYTNMKWGTIQQAIVIHKRS